MSVVSIDFQEGVNDFDVGVNESIFLSFVCPMTHMNLCANVRIFALMNVSSHYWSPFHANDCVFSRNEQQKVYY